MATASTRASASASAYEVVQRPVGALVHGKHDGGFRAEGSDGVGVDPADDAAADDRDAQSRHR
jgi:hypothetical protein